MMGISSSSESDEDDKDMFTSWDDDDSSETSSSSCISKMQLNAEDVEPVTSRAVDAKVEMDSITDLLVLFNDNALRSLASSSTKDSVQLNVLQENKLRIINWLDDLELPSSESVITQEMFCDFLTSKGVNREDAMDAFSRFDTEGCGKADAELVRDGINHIYEEIENGELSYRTRILQGCPSLPGFVDVFSKTDLSSKHAIKLLSFLIRNRASACNFRLPILARFEDTAQLRIKVGGAILCRLQKEIAASEENKLLCGEVAGDIKATGKPYSSIEVSSNSSDIYKLIDGNPGSWWQSDGPAKSHFVRLNMKKNVIVKQLFVYVASSDQSYMPQEITVSAGKRNSLKEIKDVKVPASANGAVLLIENVKVYYPVIQINVKRCQSDGCDTRVHLVKVSGLKVSKEIEMSVRDASIRWFFQLTTATAISSAQVVPAYRQIIINQAKEAFRYIPPMSLCRGSGERPRFLNEPIIAELKTFLDNVTSGISEDLADDSLLCKVMYGLAACDLASIIEVLTHLLDDPEKTINPGYLLTSMRSVKDKFWAKGEKLLPLTYLDCDGGEKQMEGVGCIQPRELLNYDSSSYTEDAYTTKKGKTKLTMILEAPESVQITHIKIRPEKGGKGAKCGILFLLPLSEVVSNRRSTGEENIAENSAAVKSKSALSPADQKALYKRLEKYDSWTSSNYEEYKKEGTRADGVLTYFSMPDDPNDWDELEMTINEQMVGKLVVIKFLKPRSESCDRIGVVGINIFGYAMTSNQFTEVDDAVHDGVIDYSEFCSHILSFLMVIIKSLANRQVSGSKLPYMDFARLTVPLITELFTKVQRHGDVIILRKVLRLCHCIFVNWAPGKDESDSSLLFDTFSSIINSPNDFDPSAVAVARMVIVDGAKAFFPNDQMRKEQLLRMLKDINRANEVPSTSLVFESLCQFFSDVEPSALLNLPKPEGSANSIDILQAVDERCFEVIDTLIVVTLQKSLTSCARSSLSPKHSAASSISESPSTLSSGVTHTVLVKLLSCLQTGFLSWISSLKGAGKEELTKKSASLLLSYLTMAVSHFVKFTTLFLELPDDQLARVFSTQDEFIFSILHQLVIFLSGYCKQCDSAEHNVDILKALWPFIEIKKELRGRLPGRFLALDSDHWSTVQTELEILNTWTEESPHNYHNNQNVTKVFSCPGATFFVIEFDPRCHTERKYDYLEFTNSAGITHKYDQKTGTDTWPLKVEIKGNKLQFHFRSDQSNNEWGYKFTVTAKGIPEAPINPLFDLHLSTALFLGQVCGQTIGMQPAVTKTSLRRDAEEDNELLMLKSNLWKTLFRAGYQPTDKLERSLSGRYMHSCYEEAKGYLLELLSDHTSSAHSGLLAQLRSRCKHYKEFGVPEISSAILHTFAAFIYHTSDLCESLNDYISNGQEESFLTEGVYQAYNLAEQLRVPLIMLRQKALEKGDSKDFTLANEMIEKANLLLKFAALKKVPSMDKFVKVNKPRKTSTRNQSNHDLLKRLEGSIPERYGQFRLVLEFIVEPSWNCLMVENAIQDRVRKAKSLCATYDLIYEYLKSSLDNHSIQMDSILFLRALLDSQKQFPLHYADAVDGCGLDQESRLRKRFYALIRLLVQSVHQIPAENQNKNTYAAHSIVQACLLHLLDMEWRDNDLVFLKEINLPKLFFEASKNNVAVRERNEHSTDDQEEITTYDRDKSYFSECHDSFDKWYSRNTLAANKNKDIQMFIARHCDLLDVDIYCDGCKETVPGKRYRCLECIDIDLCVTCFTGGVTPGGEHKDNHNFVYFMYKCDNCQSFISGERVHCMDCDDFDLCYGCYKSVKTHTGHDATHEVVRYPQVRLKSSCASNPLSAYIHQHSWLQFAQLTLSMAGTVFEQSDVRLKDSSNIEYTDTATQLLTQCLSLVTKCLQKVSTISSKVGTDADYREETFVQHSQDRIMGLLGSIINLDEQHDADLSMMLTTTDFLKFIFYIASGQAGYGQHSTVQQLALGLLTQLMQKSTISTQVTDEAVFRTQKRPLEELENMDRGVATIEFIMQAASGCLEKQQGVDWSYSLIMLLQQLVHTPHWSATMKKYILDTITELKETKCLDLVLCLFVITGFPQVKSPGVTVKYLDFGLDEKKAVILKHFPDRMQSMVIDTLTRKHKMVKDQQIECVCTHPQFYDPALASLITELIVMNSVKLMKDALLDLETHWVLCLCLKAFDQFIAKQVPYDNLNVIRCLVNLAGMGTRLSKLWLVTDLEILSLMLYIKVRNNESASGAKASTSSPKRALVSLAPHVAAAAAASPPEDKLDPFPDMDSDSRKHFMVLLEMLNVPVGTLRQVYDDHRETPSLLLQALHGLFLEDGPEKSKHSKSSSSKTTDDAPETGERMIDFGILPISALPSSEMESIECLEAVPEVEEKAGSNKNTRKNSSNSVLSAADQKRSFSAKLLKTELSGMLQKTPSHVHLNKVNLGLSILYARQSLGTILANWSVSGPRISAELLKCEEHNLALVLDVLNRDSSNLTLFEKVVSKVMSCCKEDYLQSVADSASYFMEEKKAEQAVRESPHQKARKVKGSVNINGASVLVVAFDKSCNTSSESSLDIATSEDMKKNHHRLSGPRERWRDFELPGDTLYFTYQPAASGTNKWKFTVNSAASTSNGSFFTGFVILNHILSTSTYCRIIDSATLWHRLIIVACKQTGSQRLKAIQLLLYLLKSHTKSENADDGPIELKIDLTKLSPLWKLYKKMSEAQGSEQTSPLLRALTELFFVAENVAMEWNVVGEFMSCMLDTAVLQSSILYGIKRVLALSVVVPLPICL